MMIFQKCATSRFSKSKMTTIHSGGEVGGTWGGPGGEVGVPVGVPVGGTWGDSGGEVGGVSLKIKNFFSKIFFYKFS